MPFRVTYHRAEDLVSDHEQQFRRGGLLLRASPAQPPERGTAVVLELVTPFGRVTLAAQVIQAFDGSVAVGFDGASPELAAVVARARVAPAAAAGSAPVHEWREGDGDRDADDDGAAGESTGGDNVFARVKSASQAEKVQIALHGSKLERTAILRDTNKTLHQYVLRNPNIQLDEVCQIAAMTTIAPEVIKFIASRREWYQRPEVATALVRNPKTPVPLAIQLIEHVSPSVLRQLAKTSSLRAPVLAAVRKKVVG